MTQHASDLLATLDRLGHPRALVLGDLILDRYTWGNAERVSQEAPVILLRADRREARLGGAANVCNMLRGLEAEVTCAGVLGADAEGELVRGLLRESQVRLGCLPADATRPTTVKERFLGRAQGRHAHQMLRVDSEVREPIADALADEIGEWVEDHVRDYDVVLISDYDKGVCTTSLLRRTIDAGRNAGVPVLVDPIRGGDYGRYARATTMTPNRLEAGLATQMLIETQEDAFRAGELLCQSLELDFAVVTLDRDGMALVHPDGRAELFGTRPRAVYDITGAGDMALAMIGLALAGGATPSDCLRLGNVAAGMEVERVGVAVVPRGEIRARLEEESRTSHGKLVDTAQLTGRVAEHRARGEKIVFLPGTFDLLHAGHVHALERAKQQGDVLVVDLAQDVEARRAAGNRRPLLARQDRASVLQALSLVDYVLLRGEETTLDVVRGLRPEVFVPDGAGASLASELECVAAYGGRIFHVSRLTRVTSAGIVAALRATSTDPPHHFRTSDRSRLAS